jgi:hypothetical protein
MIDDAAKGAIRRLGLQMTMGDADFKKLTAEFLGRCAEQGYTGVLYLEHAEDQISELIPFCSGGTMAWVACQLVSAVGSVGSATRRPISASPDKPKEM